MQKVNFEIDPEPLINEHFMDTSHLFDNDNILKIQPTTPYVVMHSNGQRKKEKKRYQE
jgi:hypothetical protein